VIRAREETDAGIGEFVFGTDGRGGKNLIVPAGGMRKPRTPQTAQETTDSDGNTRSENDLYMNGRDVFRFAISEVPRTYRSLLAKTGLAPEQLDYLILHQANKYMLDQLVRRLELPKEKIPYEFEDIGNTVSNTIPIVLERLLKRDTLHPGQQLMLIGFGVGYSWAACTVRWA
jgi:3-oxoacyl-[acyl-carrier-protein] synthase-3